MTEQRKRSEFTRDYYKTPDRTRELAGLCGEASRGGITRRQFVERALALGLTASAAGALMAGCGKKADETGTTAATNTIGPTTAPSELYLFNWVDYMAPGVKKDFEKKTGIKVVEAYFDDNEALLAKLKAGATGYDVIVPSDYMVHIMIMSKMLEPLVVDYIPNFKYVDKVFLDPDYDNPASAENAGMQYSTPYQWGLTGLICRADKIDPAKVAKWASIFPPDGDQFKGEIVMLNDERECLGAALKKLGYSYNTTDQGELDEATQLLIDQKPLVRSYDSVSTKRRVMEGTPIVMGWTGDDLMAIDAMGGYEDEEIKSQVKMMMPEEGTATWVDCMAIPTGYRSKYAAHLFIDYILDPKVMGKTSSWTWYLPVEMEAAKPYTDPFVFTNNPSQEYLDICETIADLGNFSRAYTDAWSQVKSS